MEMKNIMKENDVVIQTSNLLANSINNGLLKQIVASDSAGTMERQEAVNSLLYFVVNRDRPNTAVLGTDVQSKSLIQMMLEMLKKTNSPQKDMLLAYSLDVNVVKRLPRYTDFIGEVIVEFSKVQDNLQKINKGARVILHLEGIDKIDFSEEGLIGSSIRDKMMTSRISIIGEMERSKYDVANFKDRNFWGKWNVVEIKTVISNPDSVVRSSSKLLKEFFDDGILRPIYRREGVKWESRADKLKQLSDFIVMPENPITAILGVAGSGKTTLLEMLSVLSSSPEAQKNPLFQGINQFFIYSLKLSAIQKLDNYQDYINKIIDELYVAEKALRKIDRKARIVLFIDELHQLTFSAKTGSRTGADALKEKLTTSPIAVVGATTRIEFDHAFSNDQAFRERWNILQLPQLSNEDIEKVLRVRWKYFVKKVWFKKGFDEEDLPDIPQVSDEVIDEMRLRNALYRPEMGEPRKSLRILEGLAVSWVNTGNVPVKSDVLEVFKNWFGIDTEFNVPEIVKNVNKRLKGQKNAKRELEEALYYAKLQSKNSPFRPVLKLLFAGSTGVGKTACVKAVAEVYGRSADAYKQFNMPDFSGEKGEQEFRQLLGEYAEHNPNGIILLDEGEKAKNVFNAYLGILEEGLVNYIIEDGGNFIYREVSLRNNIVIMTTNAGAESLREKAKFADSGLRTTLADDDTKDMFDRSNTAKQGKSLKKELLNSGFTPELYNRFDRVILFENLDNATLLEIGDGVIDDVVETVIDSFGVNVVLEHGRKHWRSSSIESYDVSAFVLLTRMDETDTDMGGARGMIKQVGNLMSDHLIPYIFKNGLVGSRKTVVMGVGKESRLYDDSVDEYRDEMRIKVLEEE